MNVLVTGTNRGLGLAFVRLYAARGETVFATVREPSSARALHALSAQHPGIHVLGCDVADERSVQHLVEELKDQPLDIVINNAGVMAPRQHLDEVKLEEVRRAFEVNALGPLRLSLALWPLLCLGKRKVLAHVSSAMGSLSQNTSGDHYGYRMSKAALNMACRSLSIDLRAEGIVSVVLNPGWVQTDMGGAGAPLSVEESVRGMIEVLDGLTLSQSGQFFDYQGQILPW